MNIAILNDAGVGLKIQNALTDNQKNLFAVVGLDIKALANRLDLSMAIVDFSTRHAVSDCRYLRKSCDIPVVAALPDNDTSWKRLRRVDVDGFILRDAGPLEITARLNAILRRCQRNPRTKTGIV